VFYSNATFQWIPDHIPVLQRLLKALPEGGVLAVQMPDNVNEPSHVSMRETAADGPWASVLKDTPRELLPPVGVYYDALRPLCRYVDVWHTQYQHPLDGAEAIADWFKARRSPFLDPLPEAQRADFLAAYTARLTKAYPADATESRFCGSRGCF
jgi:trans-aconitate 2-methyltransferase